MKFAVKITVLVFLIVFGLMIGGLYLTGQGKLIAFVALMGGLGILITLLLSSLMIKWENVLFFKDEK